MSERGDRSEPMWSHCRVGIRALAGVVAGFTVGLTSSVLPASADTVPTSVSPVVQRPVAAVTADALPTEQIDNGVVWSETMVGNTVYAGGEFSNVRPAGTTPGTSLTARGDLMAFDVTTGNLVTSFAPTLNGSVKVLAHSPDGRVLYVGGSFTTANGLTRSKIVAYNVSTGAVVSTFAPSFNLTVNAIYATSTTVYAGGAFTQVNGQDRSHLAAVNAVDGSLTAWAPSADQMVQALVMTPDGTRLIVGGGFTTINGAPAYGLASVDPTNATLYSWAANSVVRDAGLNASILSLTTDGTYIYASGYVYGSSGNFEGVLAADPDSGTIHWLADCHGDTYGTFEVNGITYVVGHEHDCGDIGGFPDTNPRSVWHRTTAFTQAATGTVQPDFMTGYADFRGNPSPSLIDWMPDLTAGTFTGTGQAAWAVTGNSQYLVEGGEFPSVNGNKPQYGLVRFAVPSVSSDKQGPMLFGAAIMPTATARSETSVRLSWPSNWDRDDMNLTYTVRRTDRGSTPVYSVVSPSESWNLAALSWIDTGLTPGATYTYNVRATDPSSGTYQGSGNVSVTLPVTSPLDSQYSRGVLADGASAYWKLDQASGATTSFDSADNHDLTLNPGVTSGAGGAIIADSDTASSFAGSSAGVAATTAAVTSPETFTEEAWFSTKSTSGGKILGFSDRSSGTGTKSDRYIYLDAGGHVNFGVYNNGRFVVTSPATYNDGAYHQAVASFSTAGLALYVDGQLVGANSGTTVALSYSGYWRVGGDTSWSAGSFFAGNIDEVSIYPTVLAPAQVRRQYVDSGRTITGFAPPSAAFTSSATNLAVAFDGSGSSAQAGATITSYVWNFGDGSFGTGARVTHTYSSAGTFTAVLAVVDSNGLQNTTSHPVTTVAANQAPVADDSFSRVVTAGWGSADHGGAWKTTGNADLFGVDGSNGTMNLSPGTSLAASLNSVSTANLNAIADVTVNAAPVGNGASLTLIGRQIGTSDYQLKCRLLPGGVVHLTLSKVINAVETIFNEVNVAGLTYNIGDTLRLRFQITGTSTATLAGKVWKVAAAEPAAALITQIDSTSTLQAPGSFSVQASLCGTSISPMVVKWDNLLINAA